VVAGRATIPGVHLEIEGFGVLLTGAGGAGKSQLALELVSRGHALIADDAPEFVRTPDGGLKGSAPQGLGDFLVVRGLGVLNLRVLFGDGAVKPVGRLDLVVRLESSERSPAAARELLEPAYGSQEVLGVAVPELLISAVAGRSLAVILEAAVRDFGIRLKGYDALRDFMARQRRAMGTQAPEPE
jgi:HPr kinase/phosphorylase